MNVYVGNLPIEITEGELLKLFDSLGEIVSVKVMNDTYIGSGQKQGYGFVEMASKTEAQVAVTVLNGKKVRGRVIEVIEALPLSTDDGKEYVNSKKRNRYYKKRQRKY
jgi:RNA recognition motif-containing protein